MNSGPSRHGKEIQNLTTTFEALWGERSVPPTTDLKSKRILGLPLQNSTPTSATQLSIRIVYNEDKLTDYTEKRRDEIEVEPEIQDCLK